MSQSSTVQTDLAAENRELRLRLEAAEDTLRAIRANEVDALVIEQDGSERVCTLRGADEAYRTFVELMSDGAATIAADGTVLYCNRNFSEVLHSPLEQTIGGTIYDFVAPEDEGSLRALLWEGLTAASVTRRFALRCRDGAVISTVLTVTPLAVDGISGVCMVLTDLTDHEARIAAEAANRAKDRFLAALSHELRTPLTPVVMLVAAMEADQRLPQDVREDLAMVRRNVELETRLIDDLLDLSRATSGKLRLQVQPLNVQELVQAVLVMVKSDVDQKSLKLECRWDATTDRVNGDPARLQQVIWNVLKNAIKFSPHQGTIRVRLSNPSDQLVQLEISDNGIGIDPSLLPRIFNAFEQGDNPTLPRQTGLGLGLTIAKSIVEMHEGMMRADSEGLGKGATFTVTLPAAPIEAGDTAASESTQSRAEQGTGVRVLLVEDHHETAIALRRLLQAHGHIVTIADSIASALHLVSAETFDLVISDIGLPDGTGHSLMKQIKQMRSIPGVALTGYGMQDDISHSRDAGFVEHVVKPVDISQLQSVISRVVQSR